MQIKGKLEHRQHCIDKNTRACNECIEAQYFVRIHVRFMTLPHECKRAECRLLREKLKMRAINGSHQLPSAPGMFVPEDTI